MIFCPDAKDQKISAHPADGLHPEEGLGHPLEGGLGHLFGVADHQEGGVGLLGGGKDTTVLFCFLKRELKNTKHLLRRKKIYSFSVHIYVPA